MMQVTKEELANFSECSVGDIEDAMRMGFKFKTLSDSAYLFEDKRKLQNSKDEYTSFTNWKKIQKEEREKEKNITKK